ncbi:RagB/SusD family nutrient uptake outer membrane protein [Formosa sp. 3Alg 14/1]|uniref:RagB/SusD family nutrient uptake outer membrane protein n=1 Tax=unclassified Formosa TaxID=2644710 RepID=UPI0039BDCAC4
MKINKYIILLSAFLVVFSSCNEDKWLEEEVYDFYTPDNSYLTEAQFEQSVALLYNLTDLYTVWGGATSHFIFQYTTDIAYDALGPTHELNSYEDRLIPEYVRVRTPWQRSYEIIAQANTILGRIDNPEAEFSSEDSRTKLKAEALFFRGFTYKYLGILYGGVPISLEEITEPKRDFVRATQEEVFAQCIEDLTFAAENLPDVSELGGEARITKSVAKHLLAELYIINKDFSKAIELTTEVIDNPGYALMTERFGSRMDEPGDVYWDLFRRGNQNRSSGNTESLWVAQYEYNVTGGGRGSIITQYLGPGYYNLVDEDDNNLFIGPTTQNGGRGIGWFTASDFMIDDIWESVPGDMRNSEYNIIRDLVVDNPNSKFYGQKMIESGAIKDVGDIYRRQWSAIFSKTTVANNFPEELFVDEATGEVTRNASSTFRDHYQMRLAETYLLRAEAYLGNSQTGLAAEDINVLRNRANAPLVNAGDIDIDFILDERARELHFEEYRLLTLKRLNKVVDRVTAYNPYYNGKYDTGFVVHDYHTLWPIPQQEIERNTEAVLEQNPGYN